MINIKTLMILMKLFLVYCFERMVFCSVCSERERFDLYVYMYLSSLL